MTYPPPRPLRVKDKVGCALALVGSLLLWAGLTYFAWLLWGLLIFN